MKANSNRYQKEKIINNYIQLKQEAMNEVAVDMTRQSAAIFLGALMIEGSYSDDELRRMYASFVRLINTGEFMGKPVRSDEITDSVVKRLNIDLNQINPQIGE